MEKEIERKETAMKIYEEKNEYLRELYGEISPREFYRELFPLGSFEGKEQQEEGKPNGIAVDLSDGQNPKKWIVTDEHEVLEELEGARFAITSPISYYGRSRAGRNARWLYALTFDIDGVGMKQLKDLLHQMNNDVIPTATYICNSGNGVHLYYFLEEPIPMYPRNQAYLKELKFALTKRLWNGYTSSIEAPQMQGILQGFRVVGSQSKFGEGYPVRAFRIGQGRRYTVEELVSYIPDITGSGLAELKALEKRSQLTLEEAKKKYPEWYERRIEQGGRRGRWNLNRAVYDYWLNRLRKEITVGHRYFAIMTLAIYAKKCSGYDAKKNPNPVTEEELRRDAYELLEPFEKLTVEESNHFDEQDLEDALELFNEDYVTFPKEDISKLTALPIVPQIRRNGRKQRDHIKIMNFVRDQVNGNTDWRNKEGRPSARETVLKALRDYPDLSVREICEITGLKKSVIYKYKKEQ